MIEVAAAIILNEHQQVLISLRKSGTHLAGFWEFPGGKVNPGESIQDCVVREIAEEIGIEIRPIEVYYLQNFNYPEKSVRLYFLRCEILSGTPTAIEVDKVLWVHPSQLANYNFAPANNEVIKKLSEFATPGSI